MIVLGALFVVVAVGFGVGVLLDNGELVSLQWYGLTLDGFSALSVYVAGMVTMLALLVGVWLVKRGLGRRSRRRHRAAVREPADTAPLES